MIKQSIRFIGEATIQYYLGANDFFSNNQSAHFSFSHSIGGDVYHALRWASGLGYVLPVSTVCEVGIRGDEVAMQLNEYEGEHHIISVKEYRHLDTITVARLTDDKYTIFSTPSVIADISVLIPLHTNEYVITAGLFSLKNPVMYSGTVIFRDPFCGVESAIGYADMLVCTPAVVRHFTSLSGIWDACHEWYEHINRNFFVVTDRAEVYAMINGELSLFEPPGDVAVFDTALAFGVIAGLRHNENRDDTWVYAILEAVCALPREVFSHEKKPFLSD